MLVTEDCLLTKQQEFEDYVKEFSKNGLNGPCNWYRTRKVNYEDELKLPAEQAKGIQQPTLFIQALKDNVLTPELSRGSKFNVC